MIQKIYFAAAYCRGNLKIMRNIYLDHAATTPLDGKVLQAMMPYLTTAYGNADSRYALGRQAAAAVQSARDCARDLTGGSGGELYFTSCGSEANSWALKGVCAAQYGKKNVIVLSAIEHPSLIRAAEDMAPFGYETVLVYPDSSGIVQPHSVEEALSGRAVAFVGVMRANNETGVVQPAEEIYKVCKAAGAFYFCDCVQAAGAMPLGQIADGMSVSAHKFYGPKGVGALWLKKGAHICRLVSGGQQESGLRGGTTFVAGAVGLAEALSAACRDMHANNCRIVAVRDEFVARVLGGVKGAFVAGDRTHRLAGNANIAFPGCRGEQIMIGLDMRGIAVSTGSACSSGASKPSSVLLAMGYEEEVAASCVRFTFGRENTSEEAAVAADAVIAVVKELKDRGSL